MAAFVCLFVETDGSLDHVGADEPITDIMDFDIHVQKVHLHCILHSKRRLVSGGCIISEKYTTYSAMCTSCNRDG
jgi:hypothetical protein